MMEANIGELKLKILNLELELTQNSSMNSKILDQSSKLIDENCNLQDKVLELEIEIKELHKELEGEKEEVIQSKRPEITTRICKGP